MDEKSSCGKRLKEMRKESGYTQLQVAMYLNTTHATISRYESGTLEPNFQMFKELCKLYKCSADYILGISKTKKVQ